MLIPTVVGLSILAALGVFLARPRAPITEPGEAPIVGTRGGDAATLRALENAGADLSRPTHVLYYLYFPGEAEARQAADEAQDQVFGTTVREAATGGGWLCLVEGSMLPSLDNIHAQTLRLSSIAASLGGEYDGWEAAVQA